MNGSLPLHRGTGRTRAINMCAAAATLALALAYSPEAAIAQSPKSGAAQDINAKRVTLYFDNADVRYALKLLFQSAGANFTLDQAVHGTVMISLTDVPFRTALENVLRSTASQTPLTYRVEDGVYIVTVKQAPVVVEDGGGTVEQIQPKQRVVKIPLNWVDGNALALALGGTGMRLGVAGVQVMGFPNLSGGQGFGSGFGNMGQNGFNGIGQNGSGFGPGNGNPGFGNQGNVSSGSGRSSGGGPIR